ncbi:MAG: hypothetical protein HY275_01295, partial [Gemmatimonadetes bacterium]|nr:hypothetical protein [Gemmatimonadota bacterium]
MTGRSALTFGRTRLAPSPVERWLWRVTATILLVHVVLALWSGFRAIWQVLALDVVAPTTVHAGGDTVGYDAWSSGRVPVTIVVELVQGPWHDTVAVDVMRQGWIAGWDPRVFHARRMIPLDASRLRRFSREDYALFHRGG